MKGLTVETVISNALKLFSLHFATSAQWCSVAPGRVNLIGDHTDYTDGYAFPMAINRFTVMCASRASKNDGDQNFNPSNSLLIYSESINATEIIVLSEELKPVGNWSDYARGVIHGYISKNPVIAKSLCGVVIACSSNLPSGAGLSSSASFEVALATLIDSICQLDTTNKERMLICQQAEHKFAHVPCGLLDQFSVIEARSQNLMKLDCKLLKANHIEFTNKEMSWLIVQSGVKHDLSDGEYAIRYSQCKKIEEQLNRSLRDLTIPELNKLDDGVLVKRATHVISENARVDNMANAILNGDWITAGKHMYASHVSLRDDYEVSCLEIDQLIEIALDLETDKGIYGARMTGGGFGGAVIMLIKTDQQGNIMKLIKEKYKIKTGYVCSFLSVKPSEGAYSIDLKTHKVTA